LRFQVSSGHDITCSKEFVDAAEASSIYNTIFIDTLPLPSKAECQAVHNISMLNNFVFTQSGLRAWQQYGIGKGEFFPLSYFNLNNFQSPQLLEVRKSKMKLKPQAAEKSKRKKRELEEEMSPLVYNHTNMFPCPDPYCQSMFIKHGNMNRHMDFGAHKYNENTLSRSDRVRLLYEKKMLLPNSACPAMSSENSKKAVSNVKMGFALKVKKACKRFNEKQREFLIDKYWVGETTGRKFKASDVAKLMRTDGRFEKNEFLSEEQIKSFFSRYSSKQKCVSAIANENLRVKLKNLVKKN
jgi:hypothetical protein